VLGTLKRRAWLTAGSLLVVAVLLIPAGCGDGGAKSCANLITWHGHTYRGNTTGEELSFGSGLGQATRNGCDDGAGSTSDQTVTVVRIVGMDPADAIGVKGDATTEYLADR
jgi:hypothetical protein